MEPNFPAPISAASTGFPSPTRFCKRRYRFISNSSLYLRDTGQTTEVRPLRLLQAFSRSGRTRFLLEMFVQFRLGNAQAAEDVGDPVRAEDAVGGHARVLRFESDGQAHISDEDEARTCRASPLPWQKIRGSEEIRGSDLAFIHSPS